MLLRALWPLLLLAAPPSDGERPSGPSFHPTPPPRADLAALRAGLGSRCDLEAAPCEGAAAGAITRRVRDPDAAPLLLRNCSDARDFPLAPVRWASLRAMDPSPRLLLTTQLTSRAQLGPALAEAGPQAVCGGGGGQPGYRAFCSLHHASPLREVELGDYLASMAERLPAWAFYQSSLIGPSAEALW